MNGKAIFARILLRYLAGLLAAHAFMRPEDAQAIIGDPDMAMLAEVAVGGAVVWIVEHWHIVELRVAKLRGELK